MPDNDLFDTIEELPIEVQNIINKYKECTYETCAKLLLDLGIFGLTFEYGLDATPHNLEYIKYAKCCNVTKQGMNEGWYDEYNTGGVNYYKYKKDLIFYIDTLLETEVKAGNIEQSYYSKMSEDDKLEYSYNHYGIYWTEWDELDEEGYFLLDGTEVSPRQ